MNLRLIVGPSTKEHIVAKRGLNNIPIENRDYDPSFLRGNPSNRIGFLGVDGPQRAIAVIGVIALLIIAFGALSS